MKDVEGEALKILNKQAGNIAFEYMKHSQHDISGVAVGAAVVAGKELTNDIILNVFGGCNIEFATSLVVHAERVALVKAISEGYTKIYSCHVTSLNEAQRAALCGYCRQDFMYVNPEIMLFVYNPDHSEKLRVKLIDTMNYPYIGTGRIG